jgi:hypothetical protein
MSIYRQISFQDGKVIVFVPVQKNGIAVDVVEDPLPRLDLSMVTEKEFHPFRMVINLRYINPADSGAKVNQFSPPIEVYMRFESNDLSTAKNLSRDLSMGYYDGTAWIYFTDREHGFKLIPDPDPIAGGWGVVKIRKIGDPPKAWGT